MASGNPSRQYYFAFGSNMWLEQMAERCPGSTFVGKATLQGYRWQINQRHVANIVKVDDGASSDVVEGLVFSITEKDRRTLDRKEGIKVGVYERVDIVVSVHRDPHYAGKKTAFVLAKLDKGDLEDSKKSPVTSKPLSGTNDDKSEWTELDPTHDQVDNSADKRNDIVPDNTEAQNAASTHFPEGPPPHHQVISGKPTNAITYLSTKFNDDGLIREEYVQRMENAMRDAARLGVSQDFLQKYLEPYVHGEISPPDEKKKDGPSTSVGSDINEDSRRAKGESRLTKQPQPRDLTSKLRRKEKKSQPAKSRAKQPGEMKAENQVESSGGQIIQSPGEDTRNTQGLNGSDMSQENTKLVIKDR